MASWAGRVGPRWARWRAQAAVQSATLKQVRLGALSTGGLGSTDGGRIAGREGGRRLTVHVAMRRRC